MVYCRKRLNTIMGRCVMNKISIIGTGSVGSTIAYTLTVMGIASEIVLIDINQEKALGEALDIRQGTPFCSAFSIYAGDYRDAAGSDIVILTSGIARKPGQTRLELAQTNVNITKSIIPEITKYAPDSIYIIVSNPVDILTYTFHKMSGLPHNHIIGSGTILDTARLRARLAEYFNINQSNVHAYVFGEHGDSSFIPWSVANVSNVPIKDCHRLIHTPGITNPELNLEEIEQYVRKSGGRVIARKGRHLLRRFGFGVPHLQEHFQRYRYHDDRFHHDERRVRHQRCVPEHPESGWQKRCKRQDQCTADR